MEILYIQVDALVAIQTFNLHLLELATQFGLTLVTLLSTANEQSFSVHLLTMHVIASPLSGIWIFIADEAKTTRLSLIARHDLYQIAIKEIS